MVYRKALPTTTNAPLAVFGNTVLVPAGAPEASACSAFEAVPLAAGRAPNADDSPVRGRPGSQICSRRTFSSDARDQLPAE